ncbi:hypothetical protein PVK06_023733 [Gossypium arboreum]|uniref:Uncharacterized protein n=1 Tax=Gossypium arboreum TaxID=29729 RepID=A0ABR0PC41_GOSAR|nr:hypothetical protein PVK06_023733 [Gossypium arboreum]
MDGLEVDSNGFVLGECAQAVTGMRITDMVEVKTGILAFNHAAGLGFFKIVVDGVIGLH